MQEGAITLPDGRRIGYAENGVADGVPILEFHGLPGSRHYQLRDDALQAVGARLVTLERPGFGLSDPMPGRRLLDWPRDVAACADALGIESFAVLGVSAGGPNAMACGYALPDRVHTVGLVCAVGPVFDAPQFDAVLPPEHAVLLSVARQDIEAARALVRDFYKPIVETWAADPVAFFDDVLVPEATEGGRAAFLAERERWQCILEGTYGRGVDTVVDEVASTFGPWGFTPGDVRVPVRAFHGTADDLPAAPIEYVVDHVADGTITLYEGEGHFIDERYQDEWLSALL